MAADGNALGEFIRARRDLLGPAAVGLPTAGVRRVPGLRREELAVLAEVSTPYLARLEQGRDRNPSAQVIEALGRALQLDDEALAHLWLLGRPHRHGPAERPAGWVRPGLRHLLDSWSDQAAFVQDRYTTVLAANPLATALYRGFAPGTNLLRFVFTDPQARVLDPDWATVEGRIVADVRATSAGGSGPAAEHFHELVAYLTATSPTFAHLWARHEVHEKSLGVKRFCHPQLGPISLNFECLTVNGDPDQTVFVLFAEPGSPAEDSLRRLQILSRRA